MNQTTFPRPASSEHAEYYGLYINRVPDGDILRHLDKQQGVISQALGRVPEEQSGVLHEPYTWTIKQVVGHLIDVEKVFGYRAHRFACGVTGPIVGMEQNEWVDGLDYEAARLPALTEELLAIRRANLMLLRRIPAGSWDSVGTADGNGMSVRALAYCLVGHVTHHLEIVEKRIG